MWVMKKHRREPKNFASFRIFQGALVKKNGFQTVFLTLFKHAYARFFCLFSSNHGQPNHKTNLLTPETEWQKWELKNKPEWMCYEHIFDEIQKQQSFRIQCLTLRYTLAF